MTLRELLADGKHGLSPRAREKLSDRQIADLEGASSAPMVVLMN